MPEVKKGEKVVDTAPQPQATAGVPAVQTGTDVANWNDEMAKHAAVVAQQEAPSASSIGLRAGVLTYQGQPVPGNKLKVIILDSCLERTYYEGAFDPNNIRSPVCFALQKSSLKDGKWGFWDVVPDPASQKLQHATCEGCPKDKWGSNVRNDGTKSKGKACQERRRLIMIPARLDTDLTPENILTAEVATVKTPVTSTSIWGAYTQSVAALLQRPPFGVITEIGSVPNQKNQFNLTFQCVTALPNDVMPNVMKKREMVQNILMKGYEVQDNAPAPAPKENAKY